MAHLFTSTRAAFNNQATDNTTAVKAGPHDIPVSHIHNRNLTGISLLISPIESFRAEHRTIDMGETAKDSLTDRTLWGMATFVHFGIPG